MGKMLFPLVPPSPWWEMMRVNIQYTYVVSPLFFFYSKTTYQRAFFSKFIRVWQNYNKIHIAVLCCGQRCYGEGTFRWQLYDYVLMWRCMQPRPSCGAVDLSVVKSIALKNMLTRLPRSRCSVWHIKAAHKWNCWSCGGAVLTFRH